ncbi:Nn.00g098000.m01.CDS01 [Neocucurbitaria sp. VM-36]
MSQWYSAVNRRKPAQGVGYGDSEYAYPDRNDSSCIRVGEACNGYRDTETIRISDQTEFVRSKALTKASFIQSKQANAPLKLRHLPQDLQIMGRDMFFAYYVSDFCQTWDFLYQYLDHNATPEHLTLGIDAVSLAFLSHQVSSPTAKDLGRRKYCEALRKFNQELQDPEKAKATSTFEGALLLDLFEKIMTSASYLTTSSHAHVQGALALVKLRGIEQFTDGTELTALMGLTLNSTVCSLSTGRPIPEEIREIRNYTARFVDTSYPKWKLGGFMIEITDLASEMRNGKLTSTETKTRSIELDRQLEAMALEAGPVWSYERKFVSGHDQRVIVPDGFFPLYDVYPNRMITQMWNVLRLTRILLCEEIVASCSAAEDPESQAQSERARFAIVEMIREICASVPQMTNCDFAARHKLPDGGLSGPCSSQHSHTMSHILDVYILIFSLYIVAWSRNCPPTAREWTIKQLHHIANHFGIREAAVILNILKKREEEEHVDVCESSLGPTKLALRAPAGSEPSTRSPIGTSPTAAPHPLDQTEGALSPPPISPAQYNSNLTPNTPK